MNYGTPPERIAALDLDWPEYMHYLYLPVYMPARAGLKLPPRLTFLEGVIERAVDEEYERRGGAGFMLSHYIYVTARHGYASPGNPLNRPGWHCDGFGTEDVNYIWTDRYPTRFAVGDFGTISEDHVRSAEQFDYRSETHGPGSRWQNRVAVQEGTTDTLYRLDPFVVHSTPIIPAPGGERSFLKISFSRDRYNLRGNSHNYLFDYDWRMWDRSEIRNDPAYAGGDAGPQEAARAA